MSLLNSIRDAAMSVVEGLEDVEVAKSVSAGTPRQGVSVTPLACPKCGGAIQVPDGRKQCFCTYCGTPLQVDDGSQTLLYRKVDEARIREAELDNSLELARMQLEEKRRPGRIKASIILAIVGSVMMIVGWFLGSESGDSNSPGYLLSILGMFALMGIAYIWLFASSSANRTRRRK